MHELAASWWLVALRGVLAILFGVALFIWPGVGLGVLVALFGAYALLDGLFALGSLITGARHHVAATLVEGVVGVLAGVVAFAWPVATAAALVYLIGGWAVITGVVEVLAAVRLREAIANEWLLGLGGVVSILFGAYLLAFPLVGALTVVWIVAAYAVVFGVLLLLLGVRLRGMNGPLGAAQ